MKINIYLKNIYLKSGKFFLIVNQKIHFFVPQIKGLKFLKIFIFLAVNYTKFPPLFNGVKIF